MLDKIIYIFVMFSFSVVFVVVFVSCQLFKYDTVCTCPFWKLLAKVDDQKFAYPKKRDSFHLKRTGWLGYEVQQQKKRN